MKRVNTIFLFVACVSLVLTPVVFAEDQVVVKFYSHRFTETPYGDILRKQVAEYEELNPNIKVQPVESPTGERQAKLINMVLGGAPPDAVFVARDMGFYFPQGILMDLEPFIEKAGGAEYKAKFPEHASVAVTDPADGHWHALPAETQFWTMVVNVDMAKEAGVEIPEDGVWTWEEYMEVMKKFTHDDQWGYVNYGYGSTGGTSIVVGQWMLGNGGTYWGFNADCSDVNLATPENIEAFKHYVSLGLDGYQPPGYIERGGGDHYRLLGESAAATAVTHPGGVANAINKSQGAISELRPVFLPGSGQKVSLFTEAWAIAEGAEHPEEAWNLINWLNTDEKALERMQVQGTLPASISAMDLVKEVMPENAFWVDLKDHSESACYEYLPRTGEVKKAVTDAVTQAYQGQDAEKVLQDLEAQLKKILSE